MKLISNTLAVQLLHTLARYRSMLADKGEGTAADLVRQFYNDLSNAKDGDAPLNMVLHCPECGKQHIDEPAGDWTNPPHRSHLCAGCGHIWRPADVPTNGVAAVKTKGTDDSPRRSMRADNVFSYAGFKEIPLAKWDQACKMNFGGIGSPESSTLTDRLLQAWESAHGSPAPWKKAVVIVGITHNRDVLSNEQLEILGKLTDVPNDYIKPVAPPYPPRIPGIVMTHGLKTLPKYFQAVIDHIKQFEVRIADRPFMVGDKLMLREYIEGGGYTGRSASRTISYILHGGQFGIQERYCVIGWNIGDAQ